MKIFLGISSFQMLAMFRRGLFFSYLTIYLRHFLGMSVTATTLFTTLPMIVNVLAQRYVWGVISDKIQKRRVLIVWGEILAGTGTIAMFYAHKVPAEKITAGWVIIAGLTLIEIFWSMSNIGWSALIADVFEKGSRSRIMGRLESMGGMGRIAGVLAGGLLYDNMGQSFEGWGFFHGALFWISGLVMFASVVPMCLVPEGGISAREQEEIRSGRGTAYDPRIFLVFILSMALIHFGRNGVVVIMPQYLILDQGLDLSSLVLSHVMNLRSLGLILTGFTAGAACRKIGDRSCLGISSLTAVLALAIIGLTTALPWICLSSFLMGASEALIIASSYEVAASYIPPEKRGALFAVFNATFFLSWGVGATLVAGPVTDGLIAAGHPEPAAYMAAFLACGGLGLAGVLVLFLLFRMERQKA